MEAHFDQVIARLANTQISTDPFSHFMIENVFPSDLYQEIIGNLPDIFYYQNSEMYPQRYSLSLSPDNFNLMIFNPALYQFWSKFSAAICSKQFMSAILKKFNVEPSDNLFPVANLVRDLDHYEIGPHTDIPERVITLLFYLPTTNSQAHLGTSIYRPVDPHFTCPGLAHYPFDAFVKVGQAPFLPNSVLGFLRNDRSFHGVEPIGVQENERNLLGYTVWRRK